MREGEEGGSRKFESRKVDEEGGRLAVEGGGKGKPKRKRTKEKSRNHKK